jgi:hypothetical protein
LRLETGFVEVALKFVEDRLQFVEVALKFVEDDLNFVEFLYFYVEDIQRAELLTFFLNA